VFANKEANLSAQVCKNIFSFCKEMKKYIISKEPDNKIQNDDDIKTLSNNKVDVEIEPDVKSNNVNLQMCSCSIVFNCFSRPDK
jgi:hypothetical protein